MTRIAVLSGALAAALMAPAAVAQVCMDANRDVVPDLTRQLQAMVASPDRGAMAAVAGSWASQSPPAPDGSVAQTLYTYQPNGSWSYQQRVCSPNGYCGSYSGGGVFAAVPSGDGGVTIMASLTDGSYTNYCSIHRYQLGGTTMRGDDGSLLQRVQ